MIFSAIKKLPFWRRYSTKQNNKWWAQRDLDFQKELETYSHPHRWVIVQALGQLTWKSLIEIGCGAGANLAAIIKSLPGNQLGGIDINPKAIEFVSKAFQKGHFTVGSADDIMLSDKSTDIILSDMTLIYIGPLKIMKYLKEISRVARNQVVLHEYHEKRWWRRQYLRIFSGRHSYNYKKLLQRLGFYDIMLYKMPKFEKDNELRFRYLIVASVPK